MHYHRCSKMDGMMVVYTLSLLPHFKIPNSFLAYLNPKSHFMHRRFESKCSIFPLSRFHQTHSRVRLLSEFLSSAVNRNKFFGVESQNGRVNGICKHCENIVIAFVALSWIERERWSFRREIVCIFEQTNNMTKWNLHKLYFTPDARSYMHRIDKHVYCAIDDMRFLTHAIHMPPLILPQPPPPSWFIHSSSSS